MPYRIGMKWEQERSKELSRSRIPTRPSRIPRFAGYVLLLFVVACSLVLAVKP